MTLAGIPVRDGLVLDLARLVDNEQTAERLERAYSNGARMIALDFSDRDSIIAALDDPPPGLEELRACSYGSVSGESERGWSRRGR